MPPRSCSFGTSVMLGTAIALPLCRGSRSSLLGGRRVLLSCRVMSVSSISVDKPESRMDEELVIRAAGLAPRAPFTLHVGADCPDEGLRFASRSLFTSSAEGSLELDRAAAVLDQGQGRGYAGVDPMRPFWSMRPCEGSKAMLTRLDVAAPIEFTAKLCEGHGEGGRAVAECKFVRQEMPGHTNTYAYVNHLYIAGPSSPLESSASWCLTGASTRCSSCPKTARGCLSSM